MYKLTIFVSIISTFFGRTFCRPGYPSIDYYAPPKYAFNYGVTDLLTGDVKSQSESRVGGVVKGQYSLVEPDGSIRTVDYNADPVNGFNAVVSKTPSVHPPPVVNPVQVQPAIVRKLIPAPRTIPIPVPVPKVITPQHIPIAPIGNYDNIYYDYDANYGGQSLNGIFVSGLHGYGH
ncbi:hypothetical protein FQA39_LY03798 [Lamprigera yunnana]|nr:hypothetical protein FQA39_LY03798 [Lamprigera yunnana]